MFCLKLYKINDILKAALSTALSVIQTSNFDQEITAALLKELDLDHNTLVMFSSDNGTTHLDREVDYEFFQSVGPLRGLKGSLYEGGIRVPMIARWPDKVEPRTTTDHVSAFWDVLPTIAEVAGVQQPDTTDGISFAPTLLGQAEKQESHEFLYWEFTGYGGQQAVRMGDWKAVRQNMLRRNNPDLDWFAALIPTPFA